MSRVITFSRTFPASHIRKGEPTFFVEKLVNSFSKLGYSIENIDELCHAAIPLTEGIKTTKVHTIRKGKRWKVGDKFSPRVWSGKPYQSKMIKISEDIQVKKVWDFEMDACGVPSINGKYVFELLDDKYAPDPQRILAHNDGLSLIDMHYWFIPKGTFNKFKGFSGQIICWDESIEYNTNEMD